MKTELILISLLTLSGIFLFAQNSSVENLQSPEQPHYGDLHYEEFKAFQAWKSKHNVNFNSNEETYRFEQFRKNSDIVKNHNKREEQLVLGLNQFAAMSNEEFVFKHLLSSKAQVTNQGNEVPQQENVLIDWNKFGAVVPTQNQGNCGACWAFASAGALEALRYISEGPYSLLSVQQLVSCIPKSALDPGAENGCGGSEPRYAFEYTHKEGIEEWWNYPYYSGNKGFVNPCEHDKSKSVFFNDGGETGYTRIQRGDVAEMKKTIKIQPFTVSVAASSVQFQLYQSGILKSDHCGTELNHSILLYGISDFVGKESYWMVQNSWGRQWGQDGYAKIAVTNGDGVCGINMENDVPLSDKPKLPYPYNKIQF